MHRRATCLCRCSAHEYILGRRPPLAWGRRTIQGWQDSRLSALQTLQSSKEKHEIEAASPESRSGDGTLSGKDEWATKSSFPQALDTKDIYIDDLTATLEAHRETNRASLIRRVDQDANWEAPFLQPLAKTDFTPSSIKEAKVESDSGSNALTAPPPQDAVTTAAPRKCRSNEPRHRISSRIPWTSVHWPADSVQLAELTGTTYKAKPDEVLEYEASLLYALGSFTVKKMGPQYPWLASMKEAETNQRHSHQRSVT